MYFKVFYMHVYYFNLKDFLEFHLILFIFYLLSIRRSLIFFFTSLPCLEAFSQWFELFTIIFFLHRYFNLSYTRCNIICVKIYHICTAYSSWLPFKVKKKKSSIDPMHVLPFKKMLIYEKRIKTCISSSLSI